MKSFFCLSLIVSVSLFSGCISDGADTIVLLVPSSSSDTPSSSSVIPSSSSIAFSSSSEGLCAGFVKGTKRLHYEKEKEQFCDERDGQKYVYVVIGEQTWMAENLNYDVSGSKCYDNSESNCNTYGRLYDWVTAMVLPSSCYLSNTCPSQIQSPHQGICSDGWHIPSNAEWEALSSYVQSYSGCLKCDGTLLKAKTGWNDYEGASGNGTDEFGFSALPGGYGFVGDRFHDVGNDGRWWSTSEYHSSNAYHRYMGYDREYAVWYDFNKPNLLFVRCVKD